MKIFNNEAKDTLSSSHLFKLFWAAELALFLVFLYEIYIGNWVTAVGTGTAALCIISVSFVAQKGKVQLAGNLLLFLISIMMLTFMWLYEGIRDEVLLVFPAIFMFSLHIGSRIFAFIIYLFLCLNVVVIGLLNEFGYIYHNHSGSTLNSTIVIITILSITGYSVWLIAKDMKESTLALQKSKAELEEKVQARTAELQLSIDHLKQTQNHLVQSEKMASLGRMVAGVAHEINTPLGIAITASSHLEITTENFIQQASKQNISKKDLEKQLNTSQSSSKLIRKNLERAANLVQNFKEVSVDQSLEQKRQFNLKPYLQEILASLKPQINKTHHSVLIQCEEGIVMHSFPGALAQIITHLFINALAHGFENAEEGEITITVTDKIDNINILFDDNGVGITEENLAHIFEPFFTTKRGLGASGLGLHIVYNLTTQSLKGNISCISTLGQGTQFELNIPTKLDD